MMFAVPAHANANTLSPALQLAAALEHSMHYASLASTALLTVSLAAADNYDLLRACTAVQVASGALFVGQWGEFLTLGVLYKLQDKRALPLLSVALGLLFWAASLAKLAAFATFGVLLAVHNTSACDEFIFNAFVLAATATQTLLTSSMAAVFYGCVVPQLSIETRSQYRLLMIDLLQIRPRRCA